MSMSSYPKLEYAIRQFIIHCKKNLLVVKHVANLKTGGCICERNIKKIKTQLQNNSFKAYLIRIDVPHRKSSYPVGTI